MIKPGQGYYVELTPSGAVKPEILEKESGISKDAFKPTGEALTPQQKARVEAGQSVTPKSSSISGTGRKKTTSIISQPEPVIQAQSQAEPEPVTTTTTTPTIQNTPRPQAVINPNYLQPQQQTKTTRTDIKPEYFSEAPPESYISERRSGVLDKTREYLEKQRDKAEANDKGVGTNFLLYQGDIALGTAQGLKTAGQFGFSLFTKPVETISSIPKGIISAVKDRETIITSLQTKARTRPGLIIGEVGSSVIVGEGATQVANVGKNLLISKGSYVGRVLGKDVRIYRSGKEIPAESILDESSITTPSYTRSSGIKESVSEFENSPYVQTSSRGTFKNYDVSGSGSKASIGVEDTGIYVNPLGRGSGAPLGIGGSSSDLSINPVDFVSGFRGSPTITIIRTQGVSRYPRSVINEPGFEAVKKFQETTGSKTGQVFITKRSELAFGEVKPQDYFNPYLKKTMRETGSAELEAVVPKGAGVSRLGVNDDFIITQGRAVRVRYAETKGAGQITPSDLLTASQLNRETSAVSSVTSGKTSLNVIGAPGGFSSTSGGVSSRSSYFLNSSGVSSVVSNPSSISTSSAISSPISPRSYKISGTGRPSTPSVSEPGSSPPPMIPSSPPSEAPSSPPSEAPSSPPSYKPSPSVIGSSNYFKPSKTIYPVYGPIVDTRNQKTESTSGAFSVQVRRQGLFREVGVFSTPEEAFRKGKDVVSGGAGVSFKILSGGESLKPTMFNLGERFTTGKKEPEVFIQKNKFRISSQGEREEITQKGLFTIQAKRKGASFGFF